MGFFKKTRVFSNPDMYTPDQGSASVPKSSREAREKFSHIPSPGTPSIKPEALLLVGAQGVSFVTKGEKNNEK